MKTSVIPPLFQLWPGSEAMWISGAERCSFAARVSSVGGTVCSLLCDVGSAAVSAARPCPLMLV